MKGRNGYEREGGAGGGRVGFAGAFTGSRHESGRGVGEEGEEREGAEGLHRSWGCVVGGRSAQSLVCVVFLENTVTNCWMLEILEGLLLIKYQ